MPQFLVAFFIGLLIVVVLVGLVVASVVSAGLVSRFVTAPLQRLAGNRTEPTRFTISDIACLVVQLQLWLLLFVGNVPISNRWRLVGPLLIVTFLQSACWWRGVHHLTNAGITGSLRRAAYLMVTVPVAFGGALVAAIAVPVLMVMSLAALFATESDERLMFFGNLLVGVGATAIVLLATRSLTKWIVRTR